ncbi:hypothetical protein K4H00_22100, partial [Mycobacterium tuberculosis]|nr:hypothetical protein [Mycobacterium tuberculosis]
SVPSHLVAVAVAAHPARLRSQIEAKRPNSAQIPRFIDHNRGWVKWPARVDVVASARGRGVQSRRAGRSEAPAREATHWRVT